MIRVPTGRTFFGGCEIRLPPNVPLRLQAMKGPEFRALDETVMLGPGQMAIRTAIADLKTGDVLVLAGKGHETGQYIMGEVLPFSDREQAIEAAVALGGRAA